MQETQEAWVQSPGWEDPLDKETATTPVFFPGKSHGQRRFYLNEVLSDSNYHLVTGNKRQNDNFPLIKMRPQRLSK